MAAALRSHRVQLVVALAGGVTVGLLTFMRRLRRLKGHALVDKAAGNHIAVIGDTLIDIVAGTLQRMPTFGGDVLVDQPIRILLGGSAANTALQICHLKRSGLIAPASSRDECVLHSSVGKDELGQLARRYLAEANVPFSEKRVAPDQGTCLCLSGPSDRGFVTFRGSIATFCGDDVDESRLRLANHVHIAGFYNTPAMWEDLPRILTAARRRGATVSLGPQYDATGRWEGLEPVYPLLDILLPNDAEAAFISGCEDLRDAAAFFVSRGVGLVVITRGKDGALAAARADSDFALRHGASSGSAEIASTKDSKNSSRSVETTSAGGSGGGSSGGGSSGGVNGGQANLHADLRFWEQSCGQVEVVDTTGAGDAFAAGFLHAWKTTANVQEALAWGCAMGSVACTKFGASQVGAKEEILAAFLPP